MDIRVWLEFYGGPQLVVSRSTGVFYRNQTSGHSCMQREMEGFVLSTFDGAAEIVLEDYFKRYKCWSPYGKGWLERMDDLEDLSQLVRRFSVLINKDDAGSSMDLASFHFDQLDNTLLSGIQQPLEIDMERIDDLEEGWIPVKTILGKGILAFQNCD